MSCLVKMDMGCTKFLIRYLTDVVSNEINTKPRGPCWKKPLETDQHWGEPIWFIKELNDSHEKKNTKEAA